MDFSKAIYQNWLAQGFDLDGSKAPSTPRIDCATANEECEQIGTEQPLSLANSVQTDNVDSSEDDSSKPHIVIVSPEEFKQLNGILNHPAPNEDQLNTSPPASEDSNQMGSGHARPLPHNDQLIEDRHDQDQQNEDADPTAPQCQAVSNNEDVMKNNARSSNILNDCGLEENSHLSAHPRNDGTDALVHITFVPCSDMTEFEFPIEFDFRFGYISLDTTYEKLQEAVLFECASARRKKVDTMAELYRLGKGVRMESYILFGDERQPYVNKDQWRKSRFSCLRDLISPGKHHFVAFQVNVSIVSLSKKSTPAIFPGLRDPENGIEWKFNLVTHTKIPQSDVSNHAPLRTTTVAAFRKRNMDQFFLRKIPSRVINGVLVGSTDVAVPLHNENNIHPSIEGTNLAAYQKMTVEMASEFELPYLKPEDKALGVPQEPQMTFQEYQPPTTAAALPDGEIHLAVRMIDRFSNAYGYFPGHMHLPSSTLLVVHPGKGVVDAIIVELKSSLLKYAMTYGDNFLKLFHFDTSLSGKWTFELWVLPQKGPEKGKVGKLHRFKKGSLKWFLDPEMVKGGKEYPTLYMEAHMVPTSRFQQEDRRRSSGQIIQVFLNGSQGGDVESDEDDDY